MRFSWRSTTPRTPSCYDAHAYWLSDGYSRASQETDAFSYSPPILLLFQAIRAVMPWEVFAYVYSIAIALGIWVLAGPFTLLVLFTPQVATEISLGNIHIFLALVTVFGLRWPWLWSFVLLTKVTPGVGLCGSPCAASGGACGSRSG